MSTEDRNQYLVKQDSPLFLKIQEFLDNSQSKFREQLALAKELGAQGRLCDGGHLLGLVFKTKSLVPPDFRRYAGDPQDVYRPKKTSQIGREFQARFRAAYIPGPLELTNHLGGDWITMGTRGDGKLRVGFFYAEDLVKQRILHVPVPLDPKDAWKPPEECTLLKRSFYWSLKEAQEAHDAEEAKTKKKKKS